jgi:hypothetical protein
VPVVSVEAVTCAECGVKLPPSFASAEHRRPCDKCGGTSVAIAIAVTDAFEFDDAHSWTIGTTNAAAARKRQLENAISDGEAAVRTRMIGQTRTL